MLRNYYTVFRMLIEDDNVIASDLSTYTPRAFKRFFRDNLLKRNWSSVTYNTYRKCLRAYCNYLVMEEYLESNPIDKVAKRREPKKLAKALTRQQVDELIDALDVAFDRDTFLGLRNITIVHTYLHTGLRLSELTNLRMEDLRIADGYLKVVNGK